MEKPNSSLFGDLKSDLSAGLVVYLVALPLCLGIALASTGRSDLLFSGIIAGIIGGIVVGALSGSPLGVSGPAAGLVVIVLTAIKTLGSFEAMLLAIVLAGVLQVVAGICKAGIIGYYFPSSVIKGMLAAIGLILIIKQVPVALGFDQTLITDPELREAVGKNMFTQLFYSFQYTTTGAVVISIVSLGLLILFDTPFMKKVQLFRFLPGALFVVLTGILLNYFFIQGAPQFVLIGKNLVQLPVATGMNHFFSFFRVPDFTALSNPQVYITAVTLAVVASLETLLCVEATDKLDPYKRVTPTNRELIAQGAGNIVSGMIGGLPVTQVIVRSSANIDSGGKTKMSAIIHGLILLLSAIFIPAFLNYIPLASLAAILLMVGYKLSKISLYKTMSKLGWDQFMPFIITIAAILTTDLLKGIGIGMAVAIYFILRKNLKNSYHKKLEVNNGGNVVTITLSEEVTFLNKGSIQKTLDELPENSKVIIDGSRSVNIDYDVLEIIHNYKIHTAVTKNITVETISVKDVVSMGH